MGRRESRKEVGGEANGPQEIAGSIIGSDLGWITSTLYSPLSLPVVIAEPRAAGVTPPNK